MKKMTGAILIEGCIIGLFVIANGLYIIVSPPAYDEPQGIAIIAVGVFIIVATLHLDRIEQRKNQPPEE
jgi:hypothetical protein